MSLIRIEAGCSIASAQRGSKLEALETRMLLMHALGLTRVQLITQSERCLNAEEALRFTALLQRRMAGEPIAYIVGQREFFGLPFWVTTDVLIPRPETELLVELALQRAPQGGRVLDLGTGSGAIAIAIAHSRGDLQLTALDVSAAALALAQQNAVRNLPPAQAVHFLHSDWYAALDTAARFALIVSNPPYIVKDDIHLQQGDLRFEPLTALTDQADGMTALRDIIAGACDHLETGGWLLLEHGYDQAAAVRAALLEHGFDAVQSWRDLAGIERASGGKTPS